MNMVTGKMISMFPLIHHWGCTYYSKKCEKPSNIDIFPNTSAIEEVGENGAGHNRVEENGCVCLIKIFNFCLDRFESTLKTRKAMSSWSVLYLEGTPSATLKFSIFFTVTRKTTATQRQYFSAWTLLVITLYE